MGLHPGSKKKRSFSKCLGGTLRDWGLLTWSPGRVHRGFLDFKIAAQPLSELFRGTNTRILAAVVTCCPLSQEGEKGGLKRSAEDLRIFK